MYVRLLFVLCCLSVEAVDKIKIIQTEHKDVSLFTEENSITRIRNIHTHTMQTINKRSREKEKGDGDIFFLNIFKLMMK